MGVVTREDNSNICIAEVCLKLVFIALVIFGFIVPPLRAGKNANRSAFYLIKTNF